MSYSDYDPKDSFKKLIWGARVLHVHMNDQEVRLKSSKSNPVQLYNDMWPSG